MSEEFVCFCFEYTASDIVADAKKHGRSTIMERIMAEKKDGNCRCSETNPKGR
ncbi:MAG: (2Fe-2S)-binding protein [Desulfobulbaceae bacterium]